MASLACRLLDHFHGFVLTDYMIDKALRHGYAAGIIEFDIPKQLFRLVSIVNFSALISSLILLDYISDAFLLYYFYSYRFVYP